MGRLTFIFLLLAVSTACNKRTENAARMSGLWEITSTRIELFENNQPVKDSTVEQTGHLSLVTTDGLENKASSSLNYAPCWSNCSWEIPRKKQKQIFFSYYSEAPPFIQSTSVMVEKSSAKKLVLVKIFYDGDLNMLSRSTWEFTKAKL